ncbi:MULTISPECIES: hypothetical protein [unclassified Ketobacter]|uniref:hypothetical protein n=1 Tax=unclassified Ketobacter TaxID=2639109 RepID=UPI000F13AEDA|nr:MULTISPECIES: hypothetical protein [unclassified Ketobacter]RLT96189.1 MAG: hypothetical protein D9N15_12080 [Ketobacter sp.]
MSSAMLLLADSQLLFRTGSAPELLQTVRQRFTTGVDAAYIGAANGNDRAFYQLACAGLDALTGHHNNTRLVAEVSDLPPSPSPLVMLAGGSVARGWAFLSEPRVRHWLHCCHRLTGSLIIGVSAGAIHLANGLDPEQPDRGRQTFLNWLPYDIAVHEEQQHWPSLTGFPALGIPFGGGIWVETGSGQPYLRSLGTQSFRLTIRGVREPVAYLERPQ